MTRQGHEDGDDKEQVAKNSSVKIATVTSWTGDERSVKGIHRKRPAATSTTTTEMELAKARLIGDAGSLLVLLQRSNSVIVQR